MGRFTGVLGLIFMLAAAWLFSTNRKAIRWRVVATGIALQVVFAIFVTKVQWGQRAIGAAGEGAKRLLSCSFAGSRFVFGEAGAQNSNLGFMFAFQVLPAIIFIAAFFRNPLLLRNHAVSDSHRCRCHGKNDGRKRRGVAQPRSLHRDGPDRSSTHHPPVPQRPHAIRD